MPRADALTSAPKVARRPAVNIEIIFETHSISKDNELGVATGWLPGRLSATGRGLAAEMGERRREDDFDSVFVSDLRRAVETVEIAFDGSSVPIFHDSRLRECNYGDLNGAAAGVVHGDRRHYLDAPYPRGESWRQAITRVGRFVSELGATHDGKRVLIVGHVATRWGLDHAVNGIAVEDLVGEEFCWQPGWNYRVTC
jgi:2,3-bisphosphoglycerate-dependent phosphoglycerate mutase